MSTNNDNEIGEINEEAILGSTLPDEQTASHSVLNPVDSHRLPSASHSVPDPVDSHRLMTFIDAAISQHMERMRSQFTADKVSAPVRAFRASNEITFVQRGNLKQYEVNEKIYDEIIKAQTLLNDTDASNQVKGEQALNAAAKLIEERQKLIRIADRSPGKWATVDEYVRDELAQDEEDGKQLRAAEMRALRKQQESKRKRSSTHAFGSDRATSYGPSTSNYRPFRQGGGAPPRVRRQATPNDTCFGCGIKGHFREDCNSNKSQSFQGHSTEPKN